MLSREVDLYTSSLTTEASHNLLGYTEICKQENNLSISFVHNIICSEKSLECNLFSMVMQFRQSSSMNQIPVALQVLSTTRNILKIYPRLAFVR